MSAKAATTLVVLLSQDETLASALPDTLVRLDGSVEVHVLRSFDALREHLVTIVPDLLIVDSAAPSAGRARELAAQIPLMLLSDVQRPTASMAIDDIANRALATCRMPAKTRDEETRQHYHDILEASSDGIFVLVEGEFRYVNANFAASLGESPEALMTRFGLLDFVVEGEQQKVEEELAHVLVSGGRRELLEVNLRARGREACFEMACRSSVVEGRRAVVGVARDVTAEKQLQEEVERSRKRAAQVERLRALGELAAGVAHDFNNTIGTILGRVALIKKKHERGEPIDDDVNVVEVAAKSAAAVVQRIQHYSRPAGSDTWQEVHLGAVVKEGAELVRTRVPANVQLVIDVQPAPHIFGNAAELREVLLNLLTNAVDAIPGDGTVTIRCYGEGNSAVVVVEDTGQGMPESVQQRIFEPFFTTKAERGTGLGLSVSHWILRRHDAQLELHSEPGRGTVFKLVFMPMAQVVRQVRAQVNKDTLSILVVDDDKTVADMIRDLLEDQGHSVQVAHDPKDAAQLLGQHRADLMITDLDLPGMSGWQLARRVRDIQPDILVGLVTGWAVDAGEHELAARGVDFVLEKPFTVDALKTALDRVRAGPMRSGGS